VLDAVKFFFINKYYIEQEGLDIGFTLYSAPHLIWLALMTLMIVLIARGYCRADEAGRDRMRKNIALVMLGMEILKDAVVIAVGWWNPGYLPFHLCGLAIFAVLADAFCRGQKVTGQMIMFAFMPGALSALLFANWTMYPFFVYMCIHSFVYHALIVAYAVMIFASREVVPSYSGMWKSLAAVVVAIPPVYGINLLFAEHNPNFMFLMEASPGSPLVPVWNLTGPDWYIPGCVVMVGIVFHVLFGIYWGIGKAMKRK
jgi:uncharacterized membrane protein YwaF